MSPNQSSSSTDKAPLSISVIMPAYNEEGNVEKTAQHNLETFSSLGLDFDLIIIDDQSQDRTAVIAREFASHYENVHFIQHESNQGAGGAFRTGIRHAKKDYVIFAPFDNPLDREDVETYLPRMEVCDIVVGTRAERVGYTRFARFASFCYNRLLIPLLFNIGVSDVNWIQAYRRNLFSEGILEFHNSRIFFLAEILVQARRKKLIIAEVPSTMKKRLHGEGTCAKISVMWSTFCDTLRFFLKMIKEDRQK